MEHGFGTSTAAVRQSAKRPHLEHPDSIFAQRCASSMSVSARRPLGFRLRTRVDALEQQDRIAPHVWETDGGGAYR